MAVRIDLTLDCANPTRLAEFWELALGHVDEPPPAPFTSREEWLAQFDLGEDDATSLQEFPGHHVVMVDPEGNEFCVC